jgi:hypothetical protein
MIHSQLIMRHCVGSATVKKSYTGYVNRQMVRIACPAFPLPANPINFCGIPPARTVAAATKNLDPSSDLFNLGLVYLKGCLTIFGPWDCGGWLVAVASRKRLPSLLVQASVAAFATFIGLPSSSADESGASFWAPGTFANLAAVPGEPGWSFSATYFHATLMGGSNQATSDTLPLFRRTTTLTVQLDADIKTRVDLAILTPGYTFATPVWGGRLGFNLYVPVGNARTEIDQLVTGALGPIGFANQSSISDRLTSFGDPAPQLSLKWNQGVNNFMIYSRGGIPVGDYNPDRIVNLGDGHGSWDNGLGYTYFNTTTGIEFTAVSGLTYNFKNPHTDYQNGIDWHVDLEASRFLSKQFYVGAVGYSFNQLTGDTGSGATLGPYISRISAVGPEIGALFPVWGMQGSLNLRGYWEFAAQNRSSGWNTWLVFSIAPTAPTERTPIVIK